MDRPLCDCPICTEMPPSCAWCGIVHDDPEECPKVIAENEDRKREEETCKSKLSE